VARIGRTLGVGAPEAAESILRVATSQMYASLIPLLARKGINYEDFTLLCFGGAGPTHGFLLAREAGIRRVLIPLHPGVLCAAGSLGADLRRDFVRTVHRPLEANGAAEVIAAIRAEVAALTREGLAWLESHGLAFVSSRVEWAADMRYIGQSFELNVPLTEEAVADETGAALRRLFYKVYAEVYGYVDEAADLEILDVRATAIGVTPKPKLEQVRARAWAGAGAPATGERRIFFDGRACVAKVFDRSGLRPDVLIEGPAVVEQYDTTVFITPGFTATVDGFGNLIGEVRGAD
jgi:N-methylhydantoinase A